MKPMTRALCGLIGVTAVLAGPAFAQLQPSWIQRWNSGIGLSSDIAVQVKAVPAGGSLMLVQSNERLVSVVRHDAAGQRLWDQPAIGHASNRHMDMLLADDGSAVIAMVDSSIAALVVRRFDADTGALHWQRERPLAGDLFLARVHEPRIARDPHTGHVRVATSEHGDWLILDYAVDGTPGPEIVSGSPDQADSPRAILVDGPGRVVVAGYEMGESSSGRVRVVAFDADGEPRYSDHEEGDVGTLFTWLPMTLVLADDGDVMVLASPESSCGTFQARLWRLDDGGQRRWRKIWPTFRCSPFSPVTMVRLDDDSVIVVDERRSAAVRVDGAGEFVWQHAGLNINIVPQPSTVQADAQGRVRMLGHVMAAGGSGTSRLHVIEWTRDGGVCAFDTSGGDAYGADALAVVDDGWLAAGIAPGLTDPRSDAVLMHFPRLHTCPLPMLFASSFEPLPWPAANSLSR